MELLGDKAKDPEKKLALVFHQQPSTCTPQETATVMGLAAHLADAHKLGVDPTKVHLTLEFKDTGHKICVSLRR